MSWAGEDVTRLAKVATASAGEWEFLPALPSEDPDGFFAAPPDWFFRGPCIYRKVEGGGVELIELLGTEEQNAAILKAAKMQATEEKGPR